CWLADRDRYGHFGLQSEQRLKVPLVKQDGKWYETSWEDALKAAGRALGGAVETHGGSELGVLVSPRATSEEHYLAASLARSLGSESIDHRLRLLDFSHPHSGRGQLDVASEKLSTADAIFLVGSNIRHEQPIYGQRVRAAWRLAAAKIADLNSIAFVFLHDVLPRVIDQHLPMVYTSPSVTSDVTALTVTSFRN